MTLRRVFEVTRNAAIDACLICALAGCAIGASLVLLLCGQEALEQPWDRRPPKVRAEDMCRK